MLWRFWFGFFAATSGLDITTDWFTLPSDFGLRTASHQIIRATGAGKWVVEMFIENKEPEREICFDNFLDVRDGAGKRPPLLWGICTKQLFSKRIFSCSGFVF